MASAVAAWPTVALGQVVTQVERPEVPSAGTMYRQVGVRLWGLGAYEREAVDGGNTQYNTLSRVEAGDIIVNKIWARNGSVSVVAPELSGCYVSGEFPTFAPTPDRLLPQWFKWLTKTRPFWEQCDEKSRGTSGKNRIRPEKFLEIEIPLPPVDEQRRIVARIEELAARIEEARGLRREALARTDALVHARLGQLVGDPYRLVRGVLDPMPFSRIGDISTDVADGPHVTPQYVEKGIPFITAQNITSGRVDFRQTKSITHEAHEEYQKRAKAEPGDVLVTKDGTIGVPCFVDTERQFSFFVSVALIKPRRDCVEGEYLTWMLRSPYLQERIRSRSRGDMIRHLVLREIKELLVPVPPLREQHEIVAYLNSVQVQVYALKQCQIETAAELDALLPSVLDKAFRGEL
jgi:type I restriction enzyme S subunit